MVVEIRVCASLQKFLNYFPALRLRPRYKEVGCEMLLPWRELIRWKNRIFGRWETKREAKILGVKIFQNRAKGFDIEPTRMMFLDPVETQRKSSALVRGLAE